MEAAKPDAVPGPCLGHSPVRLPLLPDGELGPEVLAQRPRFRSCVPDGQAGGPVLSLLTLPAIHNWRLYRDSQCRLCGRGPAR
jgi:hypothetical protein